jgi:predicted transposase/invertase (TIGR01784 family)
MDRKSKTEETPTRQSFIRFDWVMKRLLHNKADYVVLEGFLTVLLGENVKIAGIAERERNQAKADEVNILAENDAKELFIIEIQHCYLMDYYYPYFDLSKTITGYIKIGEDHTQVRKVYHIDIVYFNLNRGEDYVYHGSASYRGIHRGDELQLTPKQQKFFGKQTLPGLYVEYYILKVENFDDYAKDSLDEWIYYLKHDVILDSFTAPGLCEARERLPVKNMTLSEYAVYEAHLMQLSHEYSIIQTAIDEGLAEGEEERKKLQVALANAVKNFIGQGMSPQQVAQILQLDEEEVRKNI